MKPRTCFSRLVICATLSLGSGLLPGCANIFVSKHKVLVDAIAAPGVTKPTGQSYRLLAKKSTVSNTSMQVAVIKACIDAALVTAGLYDAPPNVAPDMFIEVAYGTDAGPRVDPQARETFLQLSARSNPDKNLERTTGPELWDVRVGVLGVAGRAETAMPLLAAVAANYIAQDTKAEAKIEIPQNAPSIAAVREQAIKALEGKAAVPPEAAAATGATPDAASGTSAPADANTPTPTGTNSPPGATPAPQPPPNPPPGTSLL